MSATVQGVLADFIAGAPRGWDAGVAWPRVQLALLDTLAVSVAGAGDPSIAALAPYLDRAGIAIGGHCTWITPPTASLEHSALIAATCAHALDYDDVSPAWRGHPSAVLLPASTAIGAGRAVTGEDIADAYAVGFETGARLGRAVAGGHYERGWHSTSTVGTIAAAAACARLARLDAVAASHALGLAVTQAAGVQANFGTGAKPLHAGFAAAAAVRSCLLAEAGATASANALQGPAGFGDLMADAIDAAAFDGLGRDPPALQSPGVEVKLYPACYAAHRAIEAALELRASGLPDPAQVESIAILGPKGAHRPLLPRLPATAAEARFSAEYLVACALVHGAVGLAHFRKPPSSDVAVARLMARATVTETADAAAVRWGTVRLRLTGGTTREATVTTLRGNRAGGASEADVLMKADDCLAEVHEGMRAADLLDAIRQRATSEFAGFFDTAPLRTLRQRLWKSEVTERRVAS